MEKYKLRMMKSNHTATLTPLITPTNCYRFSKQNFLSEVTNPFTLPDHTPSFKEYTGSKNNRFLSPAQASKNRIQPPSKVFVTVIFSKCDRELRLTSCVRLFRFYISLILRLVLKKLIYWTCSIRKRFHRQPFECFRWRRNDHHPDWLNSRMWPMLCWL